MKNSSQNIKLQSVNTSFDVLIGRAAMLGFVIAFGAYLTAGIYSPGFI